MPLKQVDEGIDCWAHLTHEVLRVAFHFKRSGIAGCDAQDIDRTAFCLRKASGHKVCVAQREFARNRIWVGLQILLGGADRTIKVASLCSGPGIIEQPLTAEAARYHEC